MGIPPAVGAGRRNAAAFGRISQGVRRDVYCSFSGRGSYSDDFPPFEIAKLGIPMIPSNAEGQRRQRRKL